MKVLVTGSNGFLGFHLVKKLISYGHQVIAIDLTKASYSHPLLTSIACDLGNIDELLIDMPIDAICHTAAKINLNNDSEGISELTNNNIIATYKLSKFIIKHKIKKVIFSSSCSVYQENVQKDMWITENYTIKPINLYATSKLVGEWILENSLIGQVNEFIVLRYSSIYGFRQKTGSLLPIFVQKATSNETLEIYGSGNRMQDYVNIDDVVDANISCLITKLPHRTILNIGSGEPITDISLAKLIKKIWNSSSAIKVLNRNKNPDVYFNYSIKNANTIINYKPINIEAGLKLYQKHQSQIS